MDDRVYLIFTGLCQGWVVLRLNLDQVAGPFTTETEAEAWLLRNGYEKGGD